MDLDFDPTDKMLLDFIDLLNPRRQTRVAGLHLGEWDMIGEALKVWQDTPPAWHRCPMLDHAIAIVHGASHDRDLFENVFQSLYWGIRAADYYKRCSVLFF